MEEGLETGGGGSGPGAAAMAGHSPPIVEKNFSRRGIKYLRRNRGGKKGKIGGGGICQFRKRAYLPPRPAEPGSPLPPRGCVGCGFPHGGASPFSFRRLFSFRFPLPFPVSPCRPVVFPGLFAGWRWVRRPLGAMPFPMGKSRGGGSSFWGGGLHLCKKPLFSFRTSGSCRPCPSFGGMDWQ